jgi:glycosyltransferase involved in cell wall biosynthesis
MMEDNGSRPLVSCIVATRDRPHFVRQVIRCFSRQTYPERELLIADGGDQSVEDLCAGQPFVRHIRAEAGASCGACLNIAAQQARGNIMQAMDDDDYYTPGFLERSVGALEATNGDNTIVAWDCFLVLLRGDPDLRFSGHGWSAGATMCFRRPVWERTGFRDRWHDYNFLNESGATIERVHAPELYILVRHGTNNWLDLRGTDVDAYFRSLPSSGSMVRDIVHGDDVPFYEELGRA